MMEADPVRSSSATLETLIRMMKSRKLYLVIPDRN